MLVLAVVCLSLNIIATQGWSARPPRQQKGPNMSSRHIAWLQTCVVTVIFIQSRIVEMGEWLGIGVLVSCVCISPAASFRTRRNVGINHPSKKTTIKV